MNEIFELTLLTFIGSIAGLIGGVVFLIKKEWASWLSKYAIPFAAGVLLSVTLLHLIPESVHEMGEGAFTVVLLAFLGSFFFEQFFAQLHHHEERRHTMIKSATPLVLFGDTVHNLIDGIAIGAAYLINPISGFIVALATFLHETPHEIGDFGVLVSSGWSRKKAFLANFLSALATFPGAYAVYFFSDALSNSVGVMLAISAGVFLYLSASDFLPEVADEKKGPAWKELAVFILGILIIYLFRYLTPEH